MHFDRDLFFIEAERKLFHAAWAIDPLLYYLGFPRDGMIILVGCQLLIWLGAEAARKAGYSAFSPSYMRPSELKGGFMGSLFQVASFLLAVLLFDKSAAILAMLFNCVGDSAVGLAGAILYTYIGREKAEIRDFQTGSRDVLFVFRHHKSMLLMAVMFIACVIPGLVLYPRVSFLLISVGAIGAVVADGFAWRLFGYTLNDDLTITLAAGGAMALAGFL